MKKPTDDIANWRLQQENTSKPFPYIFPRMPPRFQQCCAFAKAVFLIQWDALLLFFLAVPFGFTPGLFWRCPCCGRSFPYYAPTRVDNLKEKDCLMAIEELHIKYVKLKFCPLIIPSVCPECKCKYFGMAAMIVGIVFGILGLNDDT